MAKKAKKTKEEKKYDSPTTPGLKIDKANYLTELMLIQQAQRRKQRLAPRFWQLPTWKPIYSFEIQAVKNLLKIFPTYHDLIIEMTRTGELDTFYYPRARFKMKQAIEKVEIGAKKSKEKAEVSKPDKEPLKSRTKVKKNTKISQLG